MTIKAYWLCKGKQVKKIDENGYIYYIDKELGRGGQGVVYKTKDADTAIKIALKNEQPIKDENEIKNFYHHIKQLILKPITKDMNIARPLALLKDEAGYIMNLLSDMNPLAMLDPGCSKKQDINFIKEHDFLQEVDKKDKRTAEYIFQYLKTGGLRLRLYVLASIGIELLKLHTKGLVYCDISHNNIFLSQDERPIVYLIDADNIEYNDQSKNNISTPEYETPEVMRGEPNSIYSDIYAYAILAFKILTMAHPFEGEAMAFDNWDSESGSKKERWELPWIEDLNDDSNKSKNGLRGILTISEELKSLFHSVFEEGKENKFKRPTLPIWIKAFQNAALKTIKCNSCKMSYYDEMLECPYCEAQKPKRVVVHSYCDNKLVSRFVREFDENNKVQIPYYVFSFFDVSFLNNTFLELKLSKFGMDMLFYNLEKDIFFIDEKVQKPLRYEKKRITPEKLKNDIVIKIDNIVQITSCIKIQS